LSVARHVRKIMTWDEVVAWRRRVSGAVVFTNGVFDLLHAGHVDVLAHARSQGDALVVGLNSDSSVQRLKGPGRPVRTEAERAYVLAALSDVDAVVTFSEDTPLGLIRRLRPDVLVKGGDYELGTVVGRDDVESWGGRVVIVPLRPGQSTTSIIERLRAPG
jgi:D-beta-D-heptose 7-phosphate kinase/D-beta-D-heptose 1-phosphate adenosyltransferase